jgi:hypothetical protein
MRRHIEPGSAESRDDDGAEVGELVRHADQRAEHGEEDAELVSESGVFPANTAVGFDPTSGAAAGMTAYAAAALIKGDLHPLDGTVQNFYWADSGSITVTEIGEADGSAIKATVMMTTYREVDQQTGDSITDGCTTMLVSLTFHLIQDAAAAPMFASAIDAE